MYFLLNTLWSIWMFKYVLFWLYLWQLKDYHFGRFIDHFRTHKGLKLILDPVQGLKLAVLLLFLLSPSLFVYLFFVAIFLYIEEFILFFKGAVTGSLKVSKITLKSLFLIVASFAVIVFYLFWIDKFSNSVQPQLLLVFDILTPLVISVIVLLFQPIFVFLRKQTLRRAETRIKKIKEITGLKIIAITGSYGKTSTKEFLSTILSTKYNVLKTKEHQNSEIGIAKCILKDLKPGHQIFIAEVGAYNKGKVKEVCSMLKPDAGIVTGVNEQHLALFGSLSNLLSAEGGVELAESLPDDGALVVNGDNKYCANLYGKMGARRNMKRKIYSLTNSKIDSDLWSEDVEVEKDLVSFVAMDRAKNMGYFKVNVLGKHSIQNLLGAILMAKELGMKIGDISEAAKNITEDQAGMTLTDIGNGISIIDSSYSSNPDGVFADLNYLSVFKNKKVVIMPCLIELGDKSSQIHEEIGRRLAEVADFVIVTTKDKFKEIAHGFNANKKGGEKCILCDNPSQIFMLAKGFCDLGGVILLEGRVPAELVKLFKK